MTKHNHPPTNEPTPVTGALWAGFAGAVAPEVSPEEADAAAEAVLADGDGQLTQPDGNISVDELVAAYGASQLRSEKLQQIVIKQANEIMRLRATLRNVINSHKPKPTK
jgi:hypothetical protein